jgi:hypothetical protein
MTQECTNMDRRAFIQKMLGIAAASTVTYVLPPIGGWRKTESGLYTRSYHDEFLDKLRLSHQAFRLLVDKMRLSHQAFRLLGEVSSYHFGSLTMPVEGGKLWVRSK